MSERSPNKKKFPLLGVVSLLCGFTGLVLFGSLWLGPVGRQFLSAGPLSRLHHTLERDCGSCHDAAFKSIPNAKCLSCHKLSDHAQALPELVKAKPELDRDCVDCHRDHQGEPDAIVNDSRQCTQCHAQAQTLALSDSVKLGQVGLAKVPLKSVNDWRSHPEFNLPAQDDTALKLNHAVHLRANLRGPDGSVTLNCNDCHRLAKDFRTIEPISFNRDCKWCHSLGFDENLPEHEVPHGDPDVVYNFLYAEYAKFLLGAEGDRRTVVVPAEVASRRLPGQGDQIPAQIGGQESSATGVVSRAKVEARSRVTEKLLFTKTACFLCHQVQLKDSVERSTVLSRYEVIKPEVPDRWMPGSIFSHGAHEQFSCDSCHSGALKSEKTSDLLLPKVETCQSCHGVGKAADDCVTCHSYHEQLPLEMPAKRKVMFDNYHVNP